MAVQEKEKSVEDRRRMRDVEEEKGVGNKTKRLFRFSRILRFCVCSPSSSDGCYITGKDC